MTHCCQLNFPTRSIMDSVEFWSENSYQHIDVLLKSGEPNSAVLQPYFQKNLKKIFNSFQSIYNQMIQKKKENKYSNEMLMPYINHNQFLILKSFIETNLLFIHLLERLKFEGYNGFSVLYEVTHHILYEQLYVQEIFKPYNSLMEASSEDVLIQANFRNIGLGNTPLECIYGQMYFWSIIGAEHPSILMNVTQKEIAKLPKDMIQLMTDYANQFNTVTYELSLIYPTLNLYNLSEVYKTFKSLNEDFLLFLKNIDSNYIPKDVLNTLPEIYFSIKQHIVEEHEYVVLGLCEKFNVFFNK
ncbi:MAG: hypothetical protein MJA31_04085 [Clostridia bacterium]|nr:hypothetical protein [Clostridia bacterium]